MRFLQDHRDKDSAMRAGVLLVVLTACGILIAMTMGWSDMDPISPPVNADHALWLIGLALGGKTAQAMTETKRIMASPAKLTGEGQ